MPPKAKSAGRGKAPAKRKLAEEFPPGEVLTDVVKKSWKIGAPIGQGGFGLLYCASDDASKPVGADAPYVIKVEPSDNGPLFSELKFYMRAAKPDLIGAWIKSRKLKYLGVPKYWGSGLHDKGGKRYRFMVMDRFGTDLQKKFEENDKRFPRKLVLQLGLKLVDILEYIHEHEYVHADIKAANLLLSHKNPDQVYLVDYGLAYRYLPDGVPKEYKEDPKRCHDGTIAFTSIDAHKGVSPSRRGDLEILGYCMIQWLCGRLPWEDKLQDPVYVRDSKLRTGPWSNGRRWRGLMNHVFFDIMMIAESHDVLRGMNARANLNTRCRDNIRDFMKSCFTTGNEPGEMVKFMEEVKSLGYTDKPDYQKLRSVLKEGLKSIGAADDDKLDFSASVNGAGPSAPKTAKRKKVVKKGTSDDEADPSPAKRSRPPQKKEMNGVKKASPRKRLVETGTQTSPGVKRVRGRPKKNT